MVFENKKSFSPLMLEIFNFFLTLVAYRGVL